MLETLQQTDEQLLLFLNGLHTPFWDSFMWIFTAKLTWIPMYAAILYVLLKNFRPSVSLFTVIVIALTITYADQVCATLIRPFVERMRPSNPNNPVSEFIHLVNEKRGGRYGFPSCHAANSFALAFFLMLFFKNSVLTLFILFWASLNSYSRVYIGVHYPGDLVVGMLVGLSGALLLYALFRYSLHFSLITGFLKYDIPEKLLIEHQRKIPHTQIIVYTGLISIAAIILYSLIFA